MRFLPDYRPVLFKTAVLVAVIVPLLATILAIYLLWERAVFWSDLELLATMYTLVMLGVTLGYHRMLAHRSFRCHPFIKFILLVLGSMSLQGYAIEWAATHIKHHALADREGDPHSPLEGFFHAHIGWIFGYGQNNPDPNLYCRHLLSDHLVIFISRTYLFWVVLGLVIPLVIGSWTGFLWGGLVRVFLVHHVTFSVNSVCHTFGKREFQTKDQSRNQWIVGLLTFGEGWHNNHHAFPRSAFHGLHWWQFDLSCYIIRGRERLGLADDVHRIPPVLPERYSLNNEASTPEPLEELV